MKPYSLTLLGQPVPSFDRIGNCFQMLTYGLYQELKNLSHITLTIYNARGDLTKMPESDFVLIISWGSFFNENNLKIIQSKCKGYFSFLECGEPSDFSFVFADLWGRQVKDRCLIIPAPYSPEYYINKPKEPKTILIDHFDCTPINLGLPENRWNEWDLTREIYKWIEPLKDTYKIYGFYIPNNYKDLMLSFFPSYITPISLSNFPIYMNNISKFEQFINPNRGTYPYSVLDMLLLGSRVLTPPDFVPQYQVERFNIPTFTNSDELITELQKTINYAELKKNILKCTPMNKVVQIIDSKIQEFIL